MSFALIYGLLALVVLAGAGWLFVWPGFRRRRILSRPFPRRWEAVLRERLPPYPNMPASLQRQLQDLVKLFMHDKPVVGCGGLQVTEEMKVLIAAQACLLLLNRPTMEYPDLRAIYLYPTTFRAIHQVRDELGLVSTESRDLLGESWDTGKVILAWDDVEKGVRNFHDGYNVVLHEFAHQLDHESGSANGAPLLPSRAAYQSWALVLGREFEQLRDGGGRHIMDEYGASDPAEFFAVATEAFFEEPVRLRENHRELFEQLKNYYRLDPSEWL